MKNRMFFAFGVLFITVILSGHSTAGPITYTSKYMGTVPPPVTGGTIALPAFTLSSSGSGNTAVIANQKLVSSTLPNVSNRQAWLIGGGNGTSGAWIIDASTGGSVDFSMKVTGVVGSYDSTLGYQGGFMIQVGDGIGTWTLYFSRIGVSVLGGDIVDNSLTFPWRDLTHDNTVTKTYRLAFKNGRLS